MTVFTKRIFCFILDYGIFMGLWLVLARTYGHQIGPNTFELNGPWALVPPFYWLLYFPFAEGLFGMTLSKYAFDIKVVSKDGTTPIGLGKALLRRILDMIDFSCLGIPALISVKNSVLAQRIGDRAASTIVVPVSPASGSQR